MTKIVNYIKDSYTELTNNVTWSTVEELQNLTTITVVALIIITLCILVMDKISEFAILDFIYGNLN